MKYVSNHPKLFDQPHIVFMFGFIQYICALAFEIINTVVLVYKRNTVVTVIGSFVTLALLVELQSMYHSTMVSLDKESILRKLFETENLPKIINRSKSINFSERKP